MKEKKTKTIENGRFYIALCVCIFVIAIIGYMSNLATQKVKEPEMNLANDVQQSTYTAPQPAAPKSQTSVKQKAAPPSVPTQIPQPVAKSVVTEDEIPHFIAPVGGNVKFNFSGDNLVYHESAADWRTHDGVDFSANLHDDVLASADGIVEEISSGTLGESILITHSGGFQTLYANLADLQGIKAGDEIKQGDVIGKVGESALADCTKGPHLHFELIADGKHKNPIEYIE